MVYYKVAWTSFRLSRLTFCDCNPKPTRETKDCGELHGASFEVV